jgi:hypothetical protein
LDVCSAIFLKKISSRTHTVTLNSERRGVSYIDAREKGSGMLLWLAFF